MGPEPLPTVCHPEFQPPPDCQPWSDNVFCQALNESEQDGPVRRKRTITPLSPAGEEPNPPAGRQQLGKGSLTLRLPTEPNDGHHSVHKHAIVTFAKIVASIVSAIQLWVATAGTAVATAAASTGAAMSPAATTAATAGTAVAAMAFKARVAFAATGLGHAALKAASGAASTVAVIGSEALDRKAKVEAISTTH